MSLMKIGENSLTPYSPDSIEKIRSGDDADKSGLPSGFRVPVEELSLNDIIEGYDLHQVTDPAHDPLADSHSDRVHSVCVDKSEVQYLSKFPNILRVEYTEEKSTVLPSEIAELNSVRYLQFEGTKKFKKLPKALANMPQLEALEITNVHALADISLLRELPNLRYLSLYSTSEIQDFSPLASLEQLQELQLQAMHWDRLPQVLTQLPNLKRLSLNGSVAEGTDLSILRQLDIEEIELEFATLKSTPAELADMPGLRKLKFDLCDIENFESVAGLKKLEVLDTNGLSFKAVPRSFGELPELRYLSLSSSENLVDLTALKNSRLEQLDLSSTGFAAVPAEVGEIKTLRELSLRQASNLKDISAVASLSDLEVLDLTFLSFDELPEALKSLNKLRVLDLTGAKYSLDGLAGHPSLEFVYLWEEPSGPIPPGTRYVESQSGILFER